DEDKKEELGNVMYHLAEGLRAISVYLSAFLPDTAVEIRKQIGVGERLNMYADVDFGKDIGGTKVQKGEIIFPRIDMEKELAELEAMRPAPQKQHKPAKPEITIDDFAKIDLRTGKILECEPVEKSDRLYTLQVQIGSETRQIVSGIREYFKPEELKGKSVVVVYNLKPVKLKGEMSNGMILAASDDNKNLRLVTTDGDIADGSEVR
ncbi:MAG: methionine--tRNA ligase subunit beta, partial [Clostridia bacterium]|nr:methionine--tRNA ligase subunit beta [Clostridia bacterium]